ncbi:MAG: hypothetical protein KC708_05805 [Anaerolineae bacterium]|nr:hypothetical protein [Anaerolineae bacterium]
MEFPTSLFLTTLLLSGFAIFWGYRQFKWYKLIRHDERRYHGILTNPEQYIDRVHTPATEALPVHPKEQSLVEEASRLNLIYLGSVTSEEALQREIPPVRIYIDETRAILFTIELAGEVFVSTMNTYFEDGFWLQTVYPYGVCLKDEDYEINGLKTSFEETYAFHEDALNHYLDDHRQPKPVTHLEASVNLLNEQMLKNHRSILQIGLQQFKRVLWAQFAIWAFLIFILLTALWPALLFEHFFYPPSVLIVAFIIIFFFALIWGRSTIFTTAEIRKKKKKGGHPFAEM